jgi:hypothetical protein
MCNDNVDSFVPPIETVCVVKYIPMEMDVWQDVSGVLITLTIFCIVTLIATMINLR